MATPESIAAPIENRFGDSGLMDRYLDYIQGDPIAQQVSGGDPLKKALRGISEFIPGISTALAERRGDKFGEALSYLDYLGPAGGGAKLAGMGLLEMISPLIAKYNDDIKKLRFDHRREMRNADGGDGQFAIDAANKIERKIKTLTNKRDKAISNIKDPGERKAAELSTINIFHGSPVTGIDKGIGTLKLPKELNYLKTGQRYPSSGGIYSVINPADPRLKSFSEKGSAYRINPNFNRTLDIENMPSDVRGSLGDMLQYIARPSRDTGKNMPLKRMQYQLDTMLHGGKGSVNKTPAQFSEDIANELIKKDYDSILFPPRNFKGEGETVLALNPEALNITGEIPVNELDDFIRAYLNFNK
jgi:hypothetical protein|tara:strand:- start:654 stop:1730 length:1077 start_codon:yes stop_codon:yes gene_type:complete